MDIKCHCVGLRRAAQRITRTYNLALADSGLKVTQFSLLRSIEKLGDPSLGALSAATGLDGSTLGRNVRVLARSGRLQLTGGDDERTTLVRLTSEGAKTVSLARPKWLAAQGAVESVLGADGEAMMKTLLGRLASLEG